jgi:nucleoside-diphosphate-sugar epimerase
VLRAAGRGRARIVKILIVGSTSTIARAIASRMRAHAEVKFAGRRDADYRLDLARPDSLPDIGERFDLVIHAAADFGGPADTDFVRAELVNAAGAVSACALARSVGARRVLLISSSFAAHRPGDANYGIYALSKRHGEEAAQLFCAERDLSLAIVRPSQVYDDASGCRPHQKFLYLMADRAQAGEDIEVHGSHDALRNYLYLDDLAEICARVIARQVEGVFSCAYPHHVRLSEVAAAAFGAFGRGGSLRFLPGRPDLPDVPPVEPQALYDQIDYRPCVDIDEGMRRIRIHRETVG